MFPSARSFFCARPLGMTTIIGVTFPSASRLSRTTLGLAKRCHSVSSPPMPCSRYSTGYFFSFGVARRRVDLHLARRADGLRFVGDHLQLPVRHVLALRVEPGGRLGERGHVVGVQHDGPLCGPRPGRRAADGRVREQERGELVQAAAPGQPLVRRAGRFVVHVLDPGLLQRLVIVLHALVHPLPSAVPMPSQTRRTFLLNASASAMTPPWAVFGSNGAPPKPPPPPLKPPM